MVDVTRHELIKKIQVDATPGITRLDPSKYLTEIKGIFNATPTPDGRFLYAADGDLGVVGVIDTREDKVIKVIRVGPDPWRTYMSHDGKYALSANNGDGTVSFIDTAKNAVVATYPAGQDLTGINYAAGKAFVISSTTGFIYVFDMKTLKPAGRIKIGNNLFLQTATTDMADQKMYLGSATDNSIYIIDGQTERSSASRTWASSHGARTSWTARTTTATERFALTASRRSLSLASAHRSRRTLAAATLCVACTLSSREPPLRTTPRRNPRSRRRTRRTSERTRAYSAAAAPQSAKRRHRSSRSR